MLISAPDQSRRVDNMRITTLVVLALGMGACENVAANREPARLVAGSSDTVIVNSSRPVQLPIQVLDAESRSLSDSGVRYEWLTGIPVSVTATGVATCAQAGDATVRASIGNLDARLLLRCRPVHEVRSLRMLNLVIGAPAQELPFLALDSAGRVVTLLTGYVAIQDSSIAKVQGLRIYGRAPGTTSVDMRIGDHTAHASVHVYQRVDTLEPISPGQHVAVPVQLPPRQMRRWRLPAAREVYFVTMIPDEDKEPMPRIAVSGAACVRWIEAESYFCLAQQDGEVIAYHPLQTGPALPSSGMLAVWRQEKP